MLENATKARNDCLDFLGVTSARSQKADQEGRQQTFGLRVRALLRTCEDILQLRCTPFQGSEACSISVSNRNGIDGRPLRAPLANEPWEFSTALS